MRDVVRKSLIAESWMFWEREARQAKAAEDEAKTVVRYFQEQTRRYHDELFAETVHSRGRKRYELACNKFESYKIWVYEESGYWQDRVVAAVQKRCGASGKEIPAVRPILCRSRSERLAFAMSVNHEGLIAAESAQI